MRDDSYRHSGQKALYQSAEITELDFITDFDRDYQIPDPLP